MYSKNQARAPREKMKRMRRYLLPHTPASGGMDTANSRGAVGGEDGPGDVEENLSRTMGRGRLRSMKCHSGRERDAVVFSSSLSPCPSRPLTDITPGALQHFPLNSFSFWLYNERGRHQSSLAEGWFPLQAPHVPVRRKPLSLRTTHYLHPPFTAPVFPPPIHSPTPHPITLTH